MSYSVCDCEWFTKHSFRAFLNLYNLRHSCYVFRVQPYVSLNYLRDHIEEQLGPEVVPEDYVFLRSVGRCMAVVSPSEMTVGK